MVGNNLLSRVDTSYVLAVGSSSFRDLIPTVYKREYSVTSPGYGSGRERGPAVSIKIHSHCSFQHLSSGAASNIGQDSVQFQCLFFTCWRRGWAHRSCRDICLQGATVDLSRCWGSGRRRVTAQGSTEGTSWRQDVCTLWGAKAPHAA